MKVKALGAALCGTVLLLGGCGTSGGTAGNVKYAKGGTFTSGLQSDPGNLNPLTAVQQTTFAVVPFAYDGLINVDSAGKVVPGIADKWNVTPTSATFTLRKDVTCQDGAKLTPSQAAETFDWVKNPKNHSTVIGDTLPSGDFTVKADDRAGTVTITMAKPFGFLLQGAGLVPIVCPHGLADVRSLAHGTDGTGPFKLAEYVPDDHLTFAVRKDYRWGPKGVGTNVPGFPDKVVFKIIKDDSTGTNLLLSGQLSNMTVTGPDAKRLVGHGFSQASFYQGPDEMWFNQRKGHIGTDPLVRKALAMAIDSDQLTTVVTQGLGIRASSLAINPPRPCRTNTVQGALPAHDLAAARTVLDQAGWVAGADGKRAKDGRPLKLTLLYSAAGGEATAAGMELVSQWWQQLGVEVKLQKQSVNAFVQQLFQGNVWDAAWLGVGISYPNQFMSYATDPPSPKGQNFAAVSNPEYTRLAGQALATPGDAGCALWTRAEQALFRNVDVVPVDADGAVEFGNKARFQVGRLGDEPTSLRLLATS